MYDERAQMFFDLDTGEIKITHPDHAPRVINIEEMDELEFPGEQEVLDGRRVFGKSPVVTAREMMMTEYMKRQMKW